jgi:hypothetical protein
VDGTVARLTGVEAGVFVELRIFGPLEVVDGERRLPLGGPEAACRHRALLLDANQVVSNERLIDGVRPSDFDLGMRAERRRLEPSTAVSSVARNEASPVRVRASASLPRFLGAP